MFLRQLRADIFDHCIDPALGFVEFLSTPISLRIRQTFSFCRHSLALCVCKAMTRGTRVELERICLKAVSAGLSEVSRSFSRPLKLHSGERR